VNVTDELTSDKRKRMSPSNEDLNHSELSDKELGMNRRITRRDFMNGIAMTIGATAMPHGMHAQVGTSEPQNAPGYNPPATTGMRGSHPGSFTVAHSVRDGSFWDHAGAPESTGESYDLVVVGCGISGMSAARFYRKAAGPGARVLLLDPHDDFGGHAKRNEFTVGGTKMLGFGGTYAIESPEPYSPVAQGVVRDLGIDVGSFARVSDHKVFPSYGLESKIFFDKQTFGSDRLVVNPSRMWGGKVSEQAEAEMWRRFAAEAPFSVKATADLRRLHAAQADLLPGMSSDEKKAKLARMSYAHYLTDLFKVDPQVVALLQAYPQGLYGVGIDAVSAQDAWGLGMPGFDGLKLAEGAGPGMGRDAIPNEEAEKYFFHFPDGNASIARLLVRSLIPDAVPGSNAQDIVTSQVKYDRLDRAASPVRIRLSSTVVKVKHIGAPATASEVEVSYSQQGQLKTVRAGHCILACWHTMIPYLTDELPAAQQTALRSAEKVPIVYTNVALRNWQSFVKLKAGSTYAPGSFFSNVSLDQRVSIGDYHATTKPDEPIVLTMHHFPGAPGLPARAQHRAGRAMLYGTPFEVFERNIRDQLARSLGSGGFDPATDIAAITVNRWPHGYAYQYNSLWDPFWLNGGPQPCVEARKPYGRIAIANADADAYAYTDCAIDQAYRAVGDLKLKA
jgi:spermidine dehydrogenase